MKKLLFTLPMALVASASLADLAPADAKYLNDRARAIAGFTSELQKRCLSDFSQHSKFMPAGDLVYNDAVSRAVYQSVYWSSADRGVAFTAPVKAGDSEQRNIACFYAITEQGLRFQMSQQIGARF